MLDLRRLRPVVASLVTAIAAWALAAPSEALAQKPPAAKGAKQGKVKGRGKGKPAAGAPSKTAPAASAAAPKATEPAERASPLELALAVERSVLANGLRVVLSVDRSSPTVAVAVTYDVGSRDEPKGRSGFAHLFEHMMFQGSANVPKGEHFKLVSGHGGVLNGTTSPDRTNYFEVLPQNELALALWLESDRMRSLDVSADNFENQRKVVEEEYRMGVSNVAYAPSAIRLEEIVFQGYWPYEHSTIGSMADLDAAELGWVREFWRQHYGPNNAVLSIAGDFDPAEALALVDRFFGSIPRAEIKPFEPKTLPEQTSQRTAVMHDDHARTPGVLYGWAIPPARHADHYALEIAARLLVDGESSRLHQLLVRDKALAREVDGGTEQRRGPDLFTLEVKLTDRAKVSEVEKLVEGEVKALSTGSIPDAELAKARRRAQASLVLGLQSNVARATRLGNYELFFGDAALLNAELPRYAGVTADEVRRVVASYLGPTRRTIVETYPRPADKGAAPKTAGGADESAPSGGASAPKVAPAAHAGASKPAPAAHKDGAKKSPGKPPPAARTGKPKKKAR